VGVDVIDPGGKTEPASPPAQSAGGTVRMLFKGVEKDVAPDRVEAAKQMGATVVGQAGAPAGGGSKAQLQQQILSLAEQAKRETDPAKKQALIAQGQALLKQFDAMR